MNTTGFKPLAFAFSTWSAVVRPVETAMLASSLENAALRWRPLGGTTPPTTGLAYSLFHRSADRGLEARVQAMLFLIVRYIQILSAVTAVGPNVGTGTCCTRAPSEPPTSTHPG